MVTFNDGFKLMQDDIDKATRAATAAVMSSLPENAHRFDVVKNLLKIASENVERLPIIFQCEKE